MYIGPTLPFAANNVTFTIGATTANISFTIPKLSCAPENYSIIYIGLLFQTKLTVSGITMSTSNISTVNKRYMIALTDLEEDNTYQFIVNSTNCLGATTTEAMNFTTLPTCELVN